MGRQLAALLVIALALAGCSTSASEGLSDLKESFSGGFKKDGDPYGTNRRPDVYGEFTRPTLPTMGASGYGK